MTYFCKCPLCLLESSYTGEYIEELTVCRCGGKCVVVVDGKVINKN